MGSLGQPYFGAYRRRGGGLFAFLRVVDEHGTRTPLQFLNQRGRAAEWCQVDLQKAVGIQSSRESGCRRAPDARRSHPQGVVSPEGR